MKFVFVGGAPRSGTSLLQRVLDVHPEVGGSPVFDDLPNVADLSQGLRQSVQSGPQPFYLTSDDVEDATRAYVYRLFSRVEAKHSPVYLGEKTPSNTLRFEHLAELFPDAKFIYIERDPRTVVGSLLRVGEARSERLTVPPSARTLVRAAAHTFECMEAGREFVSFHGGRRISVKHEDLVALTEANHLFSFLGLRPLHNLDMGSVKPEHSLSAKLDLATPDSSHATHIWYQTSEITAEPNPDKITKWRSELPRKSQTLNWYFRDYLNTITRRPSLGWRIVMAYEMLLSQLVQVGKHLLR